MILKYLKGPAKYKVNKCKCKNKCLLLDIIENIHSLPNVKHTEENINFQRPVWIGEVTIRCIVSLKYTYLLCNSQSRFHAEKYAKTEIV